MKILETPDNHRQNREEVQTLKLPGWFCWLVFSWDFLQQQNVEYYTRQLLSFQFAGDDSNVSGAYLRIISIRYTPHEKLIRSNL